MVGSINGMSICLLRGGQHFHHLACTLVIMPRTGATFCRWNSFPSSSLELRQARSGRFANQCGSSGGG